MKSCCLDEAKRSLKRHRDVARCDDCGMLLLAYGNDTDFQRTVDELTRHEVDLQTTTMGALKIVAKPK